MPARNKPGVNWPEIEARFKAGESARSLERFGVSKTAILKRATKEGWTATATATRELQRQPRPATPTEADRAAREATIWRPAVDQLAVEFFGKRTPETAAKILSHIEGGAGRQLAARACGVSHDLLTAWMDDEPSFASLVTQAEASKAMDRIGDIEKAAERGDWKAAEALLKRNQVSKPEWAETEKTGGVNINVSFGFEVKPRFEEAIDVTAEEVG